MSSELQEMKWVIRDLQDLANQRLDLDDEERLRVNNLITAAVARGSRIRRSE